MHARLDRHELGAALDHEPGVEAISLVHLEREAAEVAQPLLAHLEQRLALALELAGRRDDVRRPLAQRTGGSSPSVTLELEHDETSSVISRTAYAGPSRVFPESFTPPYGI